MSAAALLRLGNTGTAMKFLDWVLGVLDQCATPDQLSPVYTVTGGYLGPEAELNALAGYAGSRPVRVGNAAAQQMQLDVFGQIADLVALLAQRGCPLSSDHWRLTQLMVEAVERRWRDADHGIWEPRIPPKHHLHSKVMCWQTVDRALSVSRYLGRTRPDWSALKVVIAEDIFERAWRPDEQAFAASYDSSDADAAALCIGLSGLVPSDDSRFAGTINRVERKLREGPTVYRYRTDDGLPGAEGGFHLCTTWLIEAYALTGRIRDAEELLRHYAALAGPTGLLSEEYDPRRRRALGNHPQAYSHLGLINAALSLQR
jgi:GH15 family glucan-1,4-alpha-glucosidase